MGLDLVERRPTRFPAQGRPWATMLIANAMAVRQEYYHALARFFAASGVHVTTFDYAVPNTDVTVTDWVKDLEEMLVEARKPAPELPFLYVGHSLGGQLIGVTPGNDSVGASLHVTTGSGYYKFNHRMPILVRTLWFVLMPLFTPIFGYFPGRKLRVVGDLPRGVTWQWRRWCLKRDYLLADNDDYRARYARFTAPIFSISFEDDDLNTKNGIDHLHSSYPNVTRRHIHPADMGQSRIGHFGFFNERCREPLWAEVLDWLRRSVVGSIPSVKIPRDKVPHA